MTADVPSLVAFGDLLFGLLMENPGDGKGKTIASMTQDELATAHRAFIRRVLHLADHNSEGLQRWPVHLMAACDYAQSGRS